MAETLDEAERRRSALREPLVDLVSVDDGGSDPTPPERPYSRLSVTVLMLVSLCDAIEYSLIMPSLYAYIVEAGGKEYTQMQIQYNFGLALSVFSATSFVAKPFMGWLVDRMNYKLVYFFSISMAIAGNVLYAFAGHRHMPWMIIAGRALSGIGCANSSLSFSYVSRTVPERNRTAVMTMLGLSFPLGLVLGPALNALTALADFELLGLPVTSSNAPGLLIASIIACLLALILAAMREPPPYSETHGEAPPGRGVVAACGALASELAHPAVFRCVATIFLYNLYICAIEALVVPVTKHTFGFETLQNSFVYLGTAIEVILLSMAVMYWSKRVSDDLLVCVAGVCAVASCAFVMAWWTYAMPLWTFLAGEALMMSTIPFAFAPNRSRFSKATNASRNQGLLQALMSSMASVGSIVGPMYLSALLGEPTPDGRIAPLMFAGLAAMCAAMLGWELVALAWMAIVTRRERRAGGIPHPEAEGDST